MGTILCATRGGEASHRTQNKAISLALEQGKPLVFLYVVDTHFLDRTEHAVRPDLAEEEMTHLGEFLLAMAQERAEAQGVQAKVRIRRGEIGDELKAAAQEEEADIVILGQSVGAEPAFPTAELESLAAEIEEETGVNTRIV